jgi:cutinase
VALALTCRSVYLLGARGSGELPTHATHGLGPEVNDAADIVRNSLDTLHRTFTTLSVGYPADDVKDLAPTSSELAGFKSGNPARIALAIEEYKTNNLDRYLQSIQEGVTSTLDEARYVHAQCPKALLILAGYSQGAMAIHQAELKLAANHDTGVLAQIAGTLLIGDGNRTSHTKANEFGTSNDRSQGVATYLTHNGNDIPDPAATANVCNAGDIVCDFGINTAIHWKHGIAVHTSYTGGTALDKAAAWIASVTEVRLSVQTWAAREAPLPSNASSSHLGGLDAVGCGAPTFCVAAGFYWTSSANWANDLLTWSGSHWTAIQAPLPPNASPDPANVFVFDSVACPARSTCVVTGTYTDTSGQLQLLIESGAGTTWTAAEGPSLAGYQLIPGSSAVACATVSACVITARYQIAALPDESLLITGHGTTWAVTVPPLPRDVPPDTPVFLRALACQPTGVCDAVGTYEQVSGLVSVIETGLGTGWSASKVIPPPNASMSADQSLDAIACPTSADCVAVGGYVTDTEQGAGMILTISGTSSATIEAPQPTGGSSSLSLDSVACAPAPLTCKVLGEDYDSSDQRRSTITTGSGKAWSTAYTPVPPNSASYESLNSVACGSPSACAVVGTFYSKSGSSLPLLLVSSGATWLAAEAPLPSNAAASNAVGGGPGLTIACPSAFICIAVGLYATQSGADRGLLLTGPA